MSDFDAAKKRLEEFLGGGRDDYLGMDIRLLLSEVDWLTKGLRLAGDAQIAYREAWHEWQKRTEKAEAELAAERERAEKAIQAIARGLDALLLIPAVDLKDAKRRGAVGQALQDAREALRPAAPPHSRRREP